jgi:hypothetical protein
MMPASGRPNEGSAVHRDRIVDRLVRAGFGKRVGHVALFVGLAVVPVLALNSLATATPGDGGVAAADSRPGPTDAQRACMSQQGVTLPARGADGARPVLTPEQRQQLRDAARVCGLAGPSVRRAPRPLTDEQRQCLAEHGVTLPPRPADGSRPEVSAETRDALRQAAAECGLPVRHPHPGAGTI